MAPPYDSADLGVLDHLTNAEPAAADGGCACLSVFRFDRVWDRSWALGQMLAARRPLARLEGLRFYKQFGSGSGNGFVPVPNTAVWGLLTTWPNLDHARRQWRRAPVFQRYRDHATEAVTLFLKPIRSWGQWDGQAPFGDGVLEPDDPHGPVAVITRASVKLRCLPQFWRHAPGIDRAVGASDGVLFHVGLGDVPLVHQVTVSVWRSPTAMKDFAYGLGPHRDAVRAMRAGKWFKEELFARFRVLDSDGTWQGRDPLRTAPSTQSRSTNLGGLNNG